jgi:hypothetical protein
VLSAAPHSNGRAGRKRLCGSGGRHEAVARGRLPGAGGHSKRDPPGTGRKTDPSEPRANASLRSHVPGGSLFERPPAFGVSGRARGGRELLPACLVRCWPRASEPGGGAVAPGMEGAGGGPRCRSRPRSPAAVLAPRLPLHAATVSRRQRLARRNRPQQPRPLVRRRRWMRLTLSRSATVYRVASFLLAGLFFIFHPSIRGQ